MKRDHVSKVLKVEALSNIQKKIGVLKTYAKKGVPFLTDESGNPIHDSTSGKKILCDYPSSFSQFSRWASTEKVGGKMDEDPSFLSHSHDTLCKYPQLKNEVASLLEAVKKKATMQLASENGDKIKALKFDRDYWKAIAETEGLSMLQCLERATQAEKRVVELERALISAREMYVEMENKMNRVIAELKRQLSEVSRFRPVNTKETSDD